MTARSSYNPLFDVNSIKAFSALDLFSSFFVIKAIERLLDGSSIGNVYSGQTLKILKPVYMGDTITAVATVVDKLEEKHRVVIKTECFNQRDELVIVGEGQEYIM